MTDIFISYSQQDRDKVVALAAFLEAEGWTVWWDKHLTGGDPYRDEIAIHLAAARAVIVLWTEASVNSDFVRAEAGRAKADQKLIPVKENALPFGSIPLPFGEMHTENLASRDLIRMAVVALLAKPRVERGALWMASRTLRYEALTWAGIVGGAITIFANLQGIITLSEWARWFTRHWQELVVAFWGEIGKLLGIQLPLGVALVLSFFSFCLFTALGARKLLSRGELDRHDMAPGLKILSCAVGLWLFHIVGSIILSVFYSSSGYMTILSSKFSLFVNILVVTYWLQLGLDGPAQRSRTREFFLIVAVLAGMTSSYLILFYNAGGVSLAEALFSAIGVNFGDMTENPELQTLWPVRIAADPKAAMIFSLVRNTLELLPMLIGGLMLLMAPPQAIARRMAFVAVGLIALIALNQVARFAPEIRVLLTPPT